MERRGFTWVEWLLILGIAVVLWAILWPVFRPRPTLFTRLQVSPLRFKDAELQFVMGRLDHELRRYDRTTLQPKFIRYEEEVLKRRKITFETHKPLPLKHIFRLIEQKGRVYLEYSSCGTCGGSTGGIRVRDIKKSRFTSERATYSTCLSRDV